MEILNKLKENLFGNKIEETPTLSAVTTEHSTITIKDFKTQGFNESGYHKGDTQSLKTFFERIMNGHITDVDASEINKRQQQLLNKIEAKEKEIVGLEANLQSLDTVNKLAIENKIEALKKEIQQINIDLENKLIDGGYSKFRHYLFGTLLVILSIYLLLFYASTIYSSFFRNPASLIASAGGDVAMVMDSIFDVNGIFSPHKYLFFCYFGAAIFFALGLLPHVYAKEKDKNSTLKVISAMLIAFLIESALAYKIDLNIHNLKTMAGIPDADWHFYTSINFYMVLAFGFIAYMVWGQILESMLAEKEKTNMRRVAKLQITPLDTKITDQEALLKEVKLEINAEKAKIESAKIELKKLITDQDKSVLTPEELAKNLDDFYLGWRKHIIMSTNDTDNLAEITNIYNEMKSTIFTSTTQMAA
jgi:hypothetical protein